MDLRQPGYTYIVLVDPLLNIVKRLRNLKKHVILFHFIFKHVTLFGVEFFYLQLTLPKLIQPNLEYGTIVSSQLGIRI